jgi:hypothetical protein
MRDQKAGLRTCRVKRDHLNSYDSILEQFTVQSYGLISLMAGAARIARLTVSSANDHDTIASVSTGVAAPALTKYVIWLLHRASKLVIERL